MASLTGIRVLDLSRLLPGPFASLVLADLGAQVDKVEDTGAGDYLRHMPPSTGPDGMGAIFGMLNRNKRSIALDLKKLEAKLALLDLLPHYDVLLEQFRPGVMERLGLGHSLLLEKNPRLVLCALTGYGQTGPLRDRAGHDINYLARAGILGCQGPLDNVPQMPGFQLADVSGGLYSVIAILAALMEREKTGKGKIIDVSMVEASMGFAIAELAPMLAGGAVVSRGGEPLTGGIAAYGIYRTRDGKFMSLGALEPKFWMTFAAAVGLDAADGNGIVPGEHQPKLKEKIAAIFLTKTRAEWETFSRAYDCCLEPVLMPEELHADPHLSARGIFFDIASRLDLPQLALPITDRFAHHMAPPAHGEHGDEILREAGFDQARILDLRASGSLK